MSGPRRRQTLTYEEIAATGELIVVAPADGERDAAAIAAEIVDTLGEKAPPVGQVTGEVESCIAQLSREQLLEPRQ